MRVWISTPRLHLLRQSDAEIVVEPVQQFLAPDYLDDLAPKPRKMPANSTAI